MNSHIDDVFEMRSSNQTTKYYESNVINTHVCAVNGCNKKPITKCEICSKHYCYGHLRLDLHPLENFEVIRQFKIV